MMKPTTIFALAATGALSFAMLSAPAASAATGPTVVTGTLTSPTGAPVVGQLVALYADPNPAALAAVPVNGQVPQTLVGSTTTDASGSYSISLSSTTALQSDADANGIVSFTAESWGTAGGSMYAFSEQLTTTGLVQTTPDGTGTGTNTSSTVANMTTDPTTQPGGTVPCGQKILIANLGGKWTTVAAAFTRVGGSFTNTYGKGQYSSLGVGVNTGSGWHAGGSVRRSSDGSQGFGPATHQSTYFRTVFKYGKYNVVCVGHEALPQVWAAGSAVPSASGGEFTPAASNCVPERYGSTFTKSTSSQVQFNGGVSISGDIGINLSAQTGWDTNDETHLTAPSSGLLNNVQLCGSNDVPGGTPKKLEYIA